MKYSKINESDDIDYILDAAEEANRLRIYRSTEILKTDKGKDATASPLTVTEMKRQIGDILVGWVDVRMARGYEKSIDSLEEMEKLVESVKRLFPKWVTMQKKTKRKYGICATRTFFSLCAFFSGHGKYAFNNRKVEIADYT